MVMAATARARWSLGTSSITSAVATAAATLSKPTASTRAPASQARLGAAALARLASEKPSTAAASSRRRPSRSASIASGRARTAPARGPVPRFGDGGAQSTLKQAPEHRLFDGSVERVVAGLEREVGARSRHAKGSAHARREQLDAGRCCEERRPSRNSESQLNGQAAGADPQPARPARAQPDSCDQGAEGQQSVRKVAAHPGAALGRQGGNQLWSRGGRRSHGTRSLLRLPLTLRLPGSRVAAKGERVGSA